MGPMRTELYNVKKDYYGGKYIKKATKQIHTQMHSNMCVCVYTYVYI